VEAVAQLAERRGEGRHIREPSGFVRRADGLWTAYANPVTPPTGRTMADEARLIRRMHFTASHHYGDTDASMAENRARFGDQAEPHRHRWTVEVQVVGPVDPDTGWLTDLMALDGTLQEITAGWDEGDLNSAVAAVAQEGMQPSTENLARWLYRRLAPRVADPARLDRVRVFESDSLGSQFPA